MITCIVKKTTTKTIAHRTPFKGIVSLATPNMIAILSCVFQKRQALLARLESVCIPDVLLPPLSVTDFLNAHL